MKCESPRIENGVLKWIAGDQFSIDFEINDDETGKPLILKEGEKIEIDFFLNDKLIKAFYFDGARECSALTCVFDKETTALFNCGKYRYSIKYSNDTERHTIEYKNVAEVVLCH